MPHRQPQALPCTSATALRAGLALLVLCLLWLSSGLAVAQPQARKWSDADERALLAYTLRPELVDRALAAAQDARQQNIRNKAGSGVTSIDGMVAALNAHPQAKALLVKHQISDRDYAMTTLALIRASFAVRLQVTSPEAAGTNAANMAYAQAHMDRINAAFRPSRDNAKADQ